MSKNQFTGLCWKAQGLRMSCQYSKRPNGSSLLERMFYNAATSHPLQRFSRVGTQSHLALNKNMSFQPQRHALVLRTGDESQRKVTHKTPKTSQDWLCCCPDCSNFFLIPMEHLPEASGHHLMHNRVASSQQHHLPQGDHPLTMLERSRRYAYTWTRSLYKLPMSITSFICWLCASIASKYVSMMYIWLWHIVYDYNGLSYVCFLKNMSAKSLSITSRVL